MEKVFTHENHLIVFNLKNILEDHGIDCSIKNEYSSSGAGVLSPLETWPEIWVENKTESLKAEQIIAQTLGDFTSGKEWICTNCGEKNSANFKICWNCNQARSEPNPL